LGFGHGVHGFAPRGDELFLALPINGHVAIYCQAILLCPLVTVWVEKLKYWAIFDLDQSILPTAMYFCSTEIQNG
jgi:hypothetical protein